MLPLSIAWACGLWLVDTDFSLMSILALVTLLVSTIVLRAYSNDVQFIRVRSWAVSSLFIVISALGAHTYGWSPLSQAGGLLLLTYTIGLLLSHTSSTPQAPVLAASASLSLLTMIMPQLAWLLPLCLLSLLIPLRSLTLRSLLAIVFGLLLPYLAFVGWHLYYGSANEALQALATAAVTYSLPQLSDIAAVNNPCDNLAAPHLYRLAMCLFGLIGIVHYLHTRYADKLHTRIYYAAIVMHWPAIALLQFFTTGCDSLLASLTALYGGILLAHYFVFSRGWIANTLFWIFFLLCCYLTFPVF